MARKHTAEQVTGNTEAELIGTREDRLTTQEAQELGLSIVDINEAIGGRENID